MMDFSEALKEMKRGENVRRKTWNGDWKLGISIDRGESVIILISDSQNLSIEIGHGEGPENTLESYDILATDWMIVK